MHEWDLILTIVLWRSLIHAHRMIVSDKFFKTLIVIFIALILLIALYIHYLVVVLQEFHGIELKLMLWRRRRQSRHQLRLCIVEIIWTHIIMNQGHRPLIKAIRSLVARLLNGFTWGLDPSPSLMYFEKCAWIIAAALFYFTFFLYNRLLLWDNV